MNIAEIVAKITGQDGEIKALRTAQETLSQENATLKSDLVKANEKLSALTPSPDISAQLQAERTAHTETKSKLTAAEQRATTAETKLTTSEAAVSETKAQLDKLNASLPKERTAAVVEILGKLGIAPIKEQGDGKQANGKQDFSHLTGYERAVAAHKASYETNKRN